MQEKQEKTLLERIFDMCQSMQTKRIVLRTRMVFQIQRIIVKAFHWLIIFDHERYNNIIIEMRRLRYATLHIDTKRFA